MHHHINGQRRPLPRPNLWLWVQNSHGNESEVPVTIEVEHYQPPTPPVTTGHPDMADPGDGGLLEYRLLEWPTGHHADWVRERAEGGDAAVDAAVRDWIESELNRSEYD
jgi:hypothetical protein